MPTDILTPLQQTRIKERASDSASWRNEVDLDRRRTIGKQMRNVLEASGILHGKVLEHRQLSKMVSLQWQIQNLNPMQMPRFLGLYAYRVHFNGFTGTHEELLAQRKKEFGDEVMHPGADLEIVSAALRRIASVSSNEQGEGASSLLALNGAGPALVSGFLHLLHSDRYGLVNGPTVSPFDKDGWLKVTESQRNLAEKQARELFDKPNNIAGQAFKSIFRWQIFLQEVRQLCGFADFHELDQFLWTLESEFKDDTNERLKAAVKEIRQIDIETRTEAEKKARLLIEENLGHLTSDQLSELFTLLNTCHNTKRVCYTRFSPAFTGNNANLLIEQSSSLNIWIERLWKAGQDDVATLLSHYWDEKLSGGGRSLPTAILYLRDNQRYAVWTPNLEKALCSMVRGLPAKIPTGFSYLQFCNGVQNLRKKAAFSPVMSDFVLFKLMKQEVPVDKLPDTDKQPPDKEPTQTQSICTIADLASATYLDEGFFETADMFLKDKRQLIFCGPPGTGKTFVARKYAEYLANGGGQVCTIQFHSSYGYEDFIEGLRPSATSSGGLSYNIEAGVFKRLCEVARSCPSVRHILLIDEINRGNISRIFGELLFLLEHRGPASAIELPYSKTSFSVPENLIVLGTMNSSDRSIALLDLALRRRFHFVEMQPRSEILLGWLVDNGKPKYVKYLLDRLNNALHRAGIDQDRYVGHAYFMSPHLDEEFLKLIWKGTIEPLLKEYFFAEPEKLAEFRLEAFQKVIEEAMASEEASKEFEVADDEADEKVELS